MAISRHSDEWKRAVFMALAGGVEFHAYREPSYSGHVMLRWYAKVPGCRQPIMGHSKYDVARAAVHMMAEKDFLPDAANLRAPRSGADELRSSE